MFDKFAVIDFFDSLALGWDEGQILDTGIINFILDNAEVNPGKTVLDVACGTGVLVPFYLERGVEKVTAVDISPEMIRIGARNHQQPQVSFLLGDIESLDVAGPFDCVVVFNSSPHFPDAERLVSRLAGLLASGGRLTVAHSMSRAALDQHHAGSASKVSVRLMPAEDLSQIFVRYLDVSVVIDDNRIYQVVGVKS